MAPLRKLQLLERVEEGFREGGWNLLYISGHDEHPARYRVYRGSTALKVRVYIWNVTHGGGSHRSADEYRIQITGIIGNRFEPEIGGKTLILGYWDNEDVFAGWDYRRHSGLLGGSPSMQIGIAALQGAVLDGFAIHPKQNGELAVAFLPDFIGTYAENLEELHDTGQVPSELDVLRRIAADPDAVDDEEIEREVAGSRKWAVTEAKRALRDSGFRARVLSAYEHQCALCNMQLRLVEGAHILPVSEPTSTDDTSNGIALCVLHHRAYDHALVTFDPDCRVHVNEERSRQLQAEGLDGKLAEFRQDLRNIIRVPAETRCRPNSIFVEQANVLRGWAL